MRNRHAGPSEAEALLRQGRRSTVEKTAAVKKMRPLLMLVVLASFLHIDEGGEGLRGENIRWLPVRRSGRWGYVMRSYPRPDGKKGRVTSFGQREISESVGATSAMWLQMKLLQKFPDSCHETFAANNATSSRKGQIMKANPTLYCCN